MEWLLWVGDAVGGGGLEKIEAMIISILIKILLFYFLPYNASLDVAFPVPQGIAGSGLHTLLGIEDETTKPLEVNNYPSFLLWLSEYTKQRMDLYVGELGDNPAQEGGFLRP